MKPLGLMLLLQLKTVGILETVPCVRNALFITQDLALLSVILVTSAERPPPTTPKEEPTWEREDGTLKEDQNLRGNAKIKFVPRATPVAREPYRLAPSEMQELSNQLQELAD
ncbi:hypothetical protein Tco_0928476 [Tanacetum coccineum]